MTQKKHEEENRGEHAEVAKPTPKAEVASDAFPFTASINEPQTVSLPIPEDIEIPKPSISSLEPTDATIGDDDFTLYVTGENFFRDSVINFAGQNEPTTLEEDGRLSTGVKMDLWQGPDTVPVVINNGPESSEPVDFTFNEPASRSKKKRDE